MKIEIEQIITDHFDRKLSLGEAVTKILRLCNVSGWVATSKQMPPINTTVIGYFPDGNEGGEKVATAITYDGKKLRSDFPNSTAYCFEATHWMALPEPPCR